VVTWFNRRYLDEVRRLRGPDATDRWPVAPMFDTEAVAQAAGGKIPLRAALGEAGEERWFDVHVHDADGEIVCSAVSVDRVVGAERQLRAFMQTLTRTFADLDAGLAIFDRARRLVMFNPALSDLTGLSPGFLTAHPTLFGVLDRMRDLGRVPEPRNYGEWRRQMADLETDAAEGRFSETWALSTGETLRVTGRPHPGGAIAFIFEDISAEISLTRRFRSELGAGQAVLDTLDDAVAVFSPAGILTMANSAYAALWGDDAMSAVKQAALRDVLPIWVKCTAPTPVWTEAAAFLANPAGRTAWSSDVILLDGRPMTCRFIPLQGGSSMASFRSSEIGTAAALSFRRRA
jgi:PAS domain-containing protein